MLRNSNILPFDTFLIIFNKKHLLCSLDIDIDIDYKVSVFFVCGIQIS